MDRGLLAASVFTAAVGLACAAATVADRIDRGLISEHLGWGAVDRDFLAGVARLKWAVSLALHAPFAPALAIGVPGGVPESQGADLPFTPRPSLSLLVLTHPVRAFWEAVFSEDADAHAPELAAIDTAAADHSRSAHSFSAGQGGQHGGPA